MKGTTKQKQFVKQADDAPPAIRVRMETDQLAIGIERLLEDYYARIGIAPTVRVTHETLPPIMGAPTLLQPRVQFSVTVIAPEYVFNTDPPF